MNITSALQPVALSTVARVVAGMDSSWAEDSRTEYLQRVIDEVSAQVCEYLGVHTLRAVRTETYEVPRFRKTITLDAVDVEAAPVLRIAATTSEIATATPEVQGETFELNPRAGTLRLFSGLPWAPAYAQVVYTGGYFLSAGEVGTKHQWLTSAAEMQIAYRLQRQDGLGGNVNSSAGQGTNFTGEYELLNTVRSALKMHRRGYI